MAVASELGGLTEQTSSEPWAVTLALVGDDLDLETTGLGATGARLGGVDAGVDEVADIALETAPEVFVKGGTAGKDDVLQSQRKTRGGAGTGWGTL